MKNIKKLIIFTIFTLLGVIVLGMQLMVSADSISQNDISYTPSTAQEAKYVPNFVKTDNSAKTQTLYNPYTAKLALDLVGDSYSIGNDKWDDTLLKEGYSDLQYFENLQLYLGDKTTIEGTNESVFSSVNVMIGMKR
ncbi:MAG: hypothetical protein IKF53_05840, partial [Clostridia bacterium]|nr:hypothetical protein [Clostridia bacterium]